MFARDEIVERSLHSAVFDDTDGGFSALSLLLAAVGVSVRRIRRDAAASRVRIRSAWSRRAVTSAARLGRALDGADRVAIGLALALATPAS